MDKAALHKEIDLIQSCINRMANNSFLLKGWVVSLLTVTLALLKDNQNSPLFLLMLLFPILSFWILDAYFLTIERRYRKLYEWVIIKREQDDLEKQYDLNHSRFKDKVLGVEKSIFSFTLLTFYGLQILTLAIFIFLNFKTVEGLTS